MKYLSLLLFYIFIFLPVSAYAGQNLFAAADIEQMNGKPPAKDFTLETLEGKKVSLKDYKGKVVFLNFWATWCPPCKVEMPDMDSLYKKYKDKGLVMLAVNMQESAGTVKKFMKKNGYSFTVLMDTNGDVTELYNAIYIPITYIIDKEGRLAGKAMGAREWNNDAVSNLLEELLK